MSKEDNFDVLERVEPAALADGTPDYSEFEPMLAAFELPDDQARDYFAAVITMAWHFVRGGWGDIDLKGLIVGMALAAKEADENQTNFDLEDLSGKDGVA